MIKEPKDSCKRVCRDDDTFHHPNIASNILRRKGEGCFKCAELTGSSFGSDKSPKLSLLHEHQTKVIPQLREKIAQKFSNNNARKVVVVKQEDSDGFHQGSAHLGGMKKTFFDNDWLLFNQPSQSPITNVHRACIFPMMSEQVSSDKAITCGSRLLKDEEPRDTVMKSFNDEKHLPAITRAFSGHSQTVLSILEHEGRNYCDDTDSIAKALFLFFYLSYCCCFHIGYYIAIIVIRLFNTHALQHMPALCNV